MFLEIQRLIMDRFDENKNNHPALLKPTNLHQGGGAVTGMMAGRKFGVEISHNRRGGAQPYPCVINKRSLSQTNGNSDNFNADQVHRPITRKFAAQIAKRKDCFHEESKKLKPSSTETFTVWEDCTLTDAVEENQKDQPEPMFLETTESMQDEQMKEVEMEDIFEEPVVDIDECDANNPLAAVEYVDDLYAYYRKMENLSVVSPNYMTQQFDITEKMRAILIDWLIEVHHKFDLQHETIFLTVNLIDRFLAKQGVIRKKLQLVGLVALLLACKYEEVSVPVIEDLIIISDKAYTRKEILEMEKFMLNTLEFNMSVPTPYVFMTRFLKAAQSESKLEQLSFFFIELCLIEYETLKFAPSFLASAAIYTAQCSLYGVKQWSRTCEWHTNYSEDQLLECSRMIVGYHEKAATGRLTAVHRKYNTSKHTYAAKCEPARFLLGEEEEETMIIQQ